MNATAHRRRPLSWPPPGKEQGYTGTHRTVYRYLETLKQAEVKTSVNLHRIQKFSATTAVWFFVRDPKTLDDIERFRVTRLSAKLAPL